MNIVNRFEIQHNPAQCLLLHKRNEQSCITYDMVVSLTGSIVYTKSSELAVYFVFKVTKLSFVIAYPLPILKLFLKANHSIKNGEGA